MFHVKRFISINQTYVHCICNSIKIYFTKHIINEYITGFNFIVCFIILYINFIFLNTSITHYNNEFITISFPLYLFSKVQTIYYFMFNYIRFIYSIV